MNLTDQARVRDIATQAIVDVVPRNPGIRADRLEDSVAELLDRCGDWQEHQPGIASLRLGPHLLAYKVLCAGYLSTYVVRCKVESEEKAVIARVYELYGGSNHDSDD